MKKYKLAIAFSALASLSPLMAASAHALDTSSVDADEQARTILREARAIYHKGGAPELVADREGRLAVYRQALAKLETGRPSPAMEDDYAVSRMLFASSAALHASGGSADERKAGEAEMDRLVPLARTMLRRSPENHDLLVSLAQLLRYQTTGLIAKGDYLSALIPGREGLELVRAAVALSPDDNFKRRSLAIDLDNLAAAEAKVGNQFEANAMSLEALGHFRILAKAEPNSRPAQGSLMIALIRRATAQGEPALIDEAVKVAEGMRTRGFLVERYLTMYEAMPDFRQQAVEQQARMKKAS